MNERLGHGKQVNMYFSLADLEDAKYPSVAMVVAINSMWDIIGTNKVLTRARWDTQRECLLIMMVEDDSFKAPRFPAIDTAVSRLKRRPEKFFENRMKAIEPKAVVFVNHEGDE